MIARCILSENMRVWFQHSPVYNFHDTSCSTMFESVYIITSPNYQPKQIRPDNRLFPLMWQLPAQKFTYHQLGFQENEFNWIWTKTYSFFKENELRNIFKCRLLFVLRCVKAFLLVLFGCVILLLRVVLPVFCTFCECTSAMTFQWVPGFLGRLCSNGMMVM